MSEIITQSIQDYLKHIYELNENGGSASTNDLADRTRKLFDRDVEITVGAVCSPDSASEQIGFSHQGLGCRPPGRIGGRDRTSDAPALRAPARACVLMVRWNTP